MKLLNVSKKGLKTKFSKKAILLSLVLILLVFTGCEEKQEPTVVYVEPGQTTQQETKQTQTETQSTEKTQESEQKTSITVCEGDCGTPDIDLSIYPSPFIEGDKLNTYVIVGAKATSLEVVAATELLVGVKFTSRIGDYYPDALDTDFNSIANKNAILIGNPCNNKFIAELMPYDSDCLEEFKQGEAILKLFKTGDNTYALVVAGHSGQDTRRAAQFLGKYNSKNLGGISMTV